METCMLCFQRTTMGERHVCPTKTALEVLELAEKAKEKYDIDVPMVLLSAEQFEALKNDPTWTTYGPDTLTIGEAE